QVCLGGWVGGLDKYCDQKYQVKFTIEPSRKPYLRHTIEGISWNGLFGARFLIDFTPPKPKAPEIKETPISGSGFSASVRENTVCSGEAITLKATGGYNGITGYIWYRNGVEVARTGNFHGQYISDYTFTSSNNTVIERVENYSIRAVYNDEISGGVKTTDNSGSIPIYIHPPRPQLLTPILSTEMSCHNSFDNVVTLNAHSSAGINNFRFSIRTAAGSQIFNEVGPVGIFNGQEHRMPGLDHGLEYQAVVENEVTTHDGGIINTCPNKLRNYDTFTIRNPASLVINELDVIEYNNGAQIQCKDFANGRINVLASGGTGAYTYSSNNFTSEQSISRFEMLRPDTLYTFHVRDVNGCNTSADITLSEPDSLKAEAIASVYNTYNVRCKDGNDGVISFNTPQGGTAPYRFSINSGASYSSLNYFNHLQAGFYTLTVLDTNNCLFTDTIRLSEPPLLSLDTILAIQPACFGAGNGMVELAAEGGVSHEPYHFYIDNYPLPHTKSPAHPTYYNDSVRFTGLQTYNYRFKVRDANTCEAERMMFLNQPDSIRISFDARGVRCNGEENGRLLPLVTGGTKPYRFTWSGEDVHIQASLADTSLHELRSGQYNLLITDGHNCNAPATAIVVEPRPLWAEMHKVVNVSCFDGRDASISINSGGGYAPHSFSINGSEFKVENNTFEGLGAGVYTVVVRDAGGCEITIPDIEITRPNALSAKINVKDVSCSYGSDGIIHILASGGNGPYQYAYDWSGAFSTNNSFYNLPPGRHSVRIKDAKNCILDEEVVVKSPDPVKLSLLESYKSHCGDSSGSAIVAATGGTSPYTYSWKTHNASGNSIVNLPMGIHPIIARDAKNCLDTLYVGISDFEGPVPGLIEKVSPTCYNASNGSLVIEADGGNDGLTFQWYGFENQNSAQLEGLSAGNYLVTITNVSGCGTVATIPLEAPEKHEVVINSVSPSLCYDQCEGRISVYGSGGTEPYVFTWDDPASQTGAIAQGLCEGNYTINLVDAKGCTDTKNVSLINPVAIEIAIPDVLNLCKGQSRTLDAGNPGAEYVWKNSHGFISSTRFVHISEPGTYHLTIRNENNCVAEKAFTVEVVENLLEANFLVQGRNARTDTIVFVDVSFPKPEKIEWVFTDNVTLLQNSDGNALVIYPTAGNYQVKMRAYLGACVDEVSKEINIVNPEESEARLDMNTE
ncbi:MAG: SprB repeat-containing protein, partial [Cytophagaceae bacterium]